MKKVLSVLLVFMLVLGMTSAVVAEEEPIKLTFWTFQELHTQFMQPAVERWNANPDNPKIEVEMVVYPLEEMNNKLVIAMQSGEGAPDICDVEIGTFANYLKGDVQFAPMNEYIEPIKDVLVMSRFNNYAKDGTYYGIDYHVGAMVVYYNTEVLEAAGVNYKDIVTWDDFHEAGKKVLAQTGKPMTTWESTDCWSIYPLVNQHGGDWLSRDNEVRMDEPVVADTLAFMEDMLKDGTAVPTPGGMHHMEEYYSWMNGGNCASVVMPFWYVNRFTNYMPDLKGKMKIGVMPTWTDGGYKSAQMGGTGTVALNTAGNKNVEVAKAFLADAKLSKEGAISCWTLLGFDPVRTDVYGTPEMAAPNEFYDYYGDDLFDAVSSVLDDIPDTALTSLYPAATDIVKGTMAYDIVIGLKDPTEGVKAGPDALRSMAE